MDDKINEVDLAFVVDTTSSMSSLITAAQRQMIQIIEELTHAADIRLNLGVVGYRDHPPQDTILYNVYAFTASLKKAQRTINDLQVIGGGDMPEAVLDGIVAACRELSWRKHARRLLVLVGDAPPHGVGARGDAFRDGCPCGETIASVTALAEEQCVTIHALGLTDMVKESFSEISALTGGRFFSSNQADQALEHLASLLRVEFAELEADRRVLQLQKKQPDLSIEELANQLQLSRHAVSASLVRLLSRDLLEVPAQA